MQTMTRSRMEHFTQEPKITHWTFYELVHEANEILGMNYKFTCIVASESDPAVRDFINRNFDIDLLVEFTHELSGSKAKDARTKEYKVIRYMEVLIFGFICTSRSTNNGNAADNVGCVQDAKDKTGESFAETRLVIARHRPGRLYGENLKTLEAATPDHDHGSDSDYIKVEMRQLGYWCDAFIVRSTNHGSTAERVRWLLHGIRNDLK